MNWATTPLSPSQLRAMLALGRIGRRQAWRGRYHARTIDNLRCRRFIEGGVQVELTMAGETWLAGFKAGQEWER